MKNSELAQKELLKRLANDNKWWHTGDIPRIYREMSPRPYLNDFYPEILKNSIRRAPILMGPRRVGKTVMLYHCIQRLIDRGVDPRKIVYLSVDTPIYSNRSLEELFRLAVEAADGDCEKDGYYVFFDEIQYLKEWERHLKSLVDTYPETKFIASGSAAAALKMKSQESGAGRFTDFMLPPVTFSEFMEMRGLESLIVERADLEWGIYDTEDIEELNRHFIDYVNYGGYPEVLFSEEVRSDIGRYVKDDIVEKVLMRDLPSLYGISDIQELNLFFAHLAFRSGNEFSYQNLSMDSLVRKETARKYLQYLEAAFLVKVLNRIDQNARRFERVTTFKVYLTNPLLRSALFSPIEEDNDAFGALIETAVVDQWLPSDTSDMYYANWHNGRLKGEVDLVWTDKATQKARSAVEIKWTDRFVESPYGLRSLKSFLEKNRTVKRVIVTSKTKWNALKEEDISMVFVPASLYAYNVSKLLHDKREDLLFQ